MFYVNQNAKNFQMFRYGRMWHVFINHGESDKMYMTTNQFKAYDYAWSPARRRSTGCGRKLWDFDLARKAIPIGRPQADHFAGDAAVPAMTAATVVLYAPTWEGDRPAAAYGSIASHGVALAAAVLASPEHRLVYRPHPRSGVIDPDYRAANQRIIAAIAAANAARSRARTTSSTTGRTSAGSSRPPTSRSPTSRRWSTTGSRPASRSSSPARSRPMPRSTKTGSWVPRTWLRGRATPATCSPLVDQVPHDDPGRRRCSTTGRSGTSATRPRAARRSASTTRSSACWPSGSGTRRSTRATATSSESDPFDDEEDDEDGALPATS